MTDDKLNSLDDTSWASESESLDAAGAWRDKVCHYTYVVVYRTGGVEVLDAKDFDASALDDVLELRAFNEAGELHAVRRESDGWVGRVRTDRDVGEKAASILDELHILWGKTATKQNDGSFLLREDRGTQLKVPADVLPEGNLPEGKRLALKVRNYLDAGDSFAFTDYRFVGFRVVSERR